MARRSAGVTVLAVRWAVSRRQVASSPGRLVAERRVRCLQAYGWAAGSPEALDGSRVVEPGGRWWTEAG
jgi:hypothetical protein